MYFKYIFKYVFKLYFLNCASGRIARNCETMEIRAYSDYSIRVLIQAALRRPDRVTVDEVTATYGISRHHLVKIVHDLGRNGYLATRRGIGGGFTLARPPEEIRLGEVIRMGEKSDKVIDCFDAADRKCRLLPCCRLKSALDEAAAAFFAVLDGYTLADLIAQPSQMRSVLGL